MKARYRVIILAMIAVMAIGLSACTGFIKPKPPETDTENRFDLYGLKMPVSQNAIQGHKVVLTETGFDCTIGSTTVVSFLTRHPLDISAGGTAVFLADLGAANTATTGFLAYFGYTDGSRQFESSPVTVTIANGSATCRYTAPDNYKLTYVRFSYGAPYNTLSLTNVRLYEEGVNKNQFDRRYMYPDYTPATNMPGYCDFVNDTATGARWVFSASNSGSLYSNVQHLNLEPNVGLRIDAGSSAYSTTSNQVYLNIVYTEDENYTFQTKRIQLTKALDTQFVPGTPFFHILHYYFERSGVSAGSYYTFDNFRLLPV